MPTFTKAYIGSTPLFKEQGFAYIEGADAGGGVQSLTNEFKHNTGTLTIFGNVTSTKDFHLCEGSSAIPANCVISGTLTQTNAGPQGGSSSQRGFTIAQSATNVGTLTISGNVTLYSGMFIGDGDGYLQRRHAHDHSTVCLWRRTRHGQPESRLRGYHERRRA